MVRYATTKDLERLEPLAREFYSKSQFLQNFNMDRFIDLWTRLIQSDTGVIFLLFECGEIVGAIGGVAYPATYSLSLIATEFFWYVREGNRGGGMRLYREFEAWAEFMECSQIRMVHLLDSMPKKLEALYRRLGYVPAETHYVKDLQKRSKAA